MRRRTSPQRGKSRRLTKKKVLLIVAVLLIAGILYATMHKGDSNQATTNPSPPASSDDGNVNLNPPTEDEKQQAEQNKEQIVKRNEQLNSPTPPPTPSPSGLKAADVVIVDISSTEVRAQITNIREEGGACTATANKDGVTISSKTSYGIISNSYTQCPPIQWNETLGDGTWNITVKYKSATSEGTATKSKVL